MILDAAVYFDRVILDAAKVNRDKQTRIFIIFNILGLYSVIREYGAVMKIQEPPKHNFD